MKARPLEKFSEEYSIFYGGILIELSSEVAGVFKNLPWRWRLPTKVKGPAFRVRVIETILPSVGKPFRISNGKEETIIEIDPSESARLAVPLLESTIVRTLATRGWFEWHSSGVIIKGKAVLFAGPSGSGKSSCAYLLSQRAAFLADDSVFLKRSGKRVTVRSVETDSLLRKDAVSRFGVVAKKEKPSQPGAESKWHVIHRRTDRAIPVGAVLFTHVGKLTQTKIRPLSEREFLLQALKHFEHILPGDGLESYLDLCSLLSKSAYVGKLTLGKYSSKMFDLVESFLTEGLE